MGLEAVTHITDLVETNPDGAVDPKSAGDEHLRNIKKAIKNTFQGTTKIRATVATAAELRTLASPGVNAATAVIPGVASFYWSSGSTATDDGVAVVKPDSVLVGSAGRWLQQPISIPNSDVTGGVPSTFDIHVRRSVKNLVSTFGAPTDEATSATTQINNAIAWAGANRGKLVAPPGLTFVLDAPLVVPANADMSLDLQEAILSYSGVGNLVTFAGETNGFAIENGAIICTGASAGAAIFGDRLGTSPLRKHRYMNLTISGFLHAYVGGGAQDWKIHHGNITGTGKGSGGSGIMAGVSALKGANMISVHGVYAALFSHVVYNISCAPLNISDAILGTSTYLVRAAGGITLGDGLYLEDDGTQTAIGFYLEGGYVKARVLRTSNLRPENLVVTAGSHRAWISMADGALHAVGTRNTAYSQVAADGLKILPIDTAVENDHGILNVAAGADQGKITVPITTFYDVYGMAVYDATAGGQTVKTALLNGASVLQQQDCVWHSGSIGPLGGPLLAKNAWLTAGDVITLRTEVSANMNLRNAVLSISPSAG